MAMGCTGDTSSYLCVSPGSLLVPSGSGPVLLEPMSAFVVSRSAAAVSRYSGLIKEVLVLVRS